MSTKTKFGNIKDLATDPAMEMNGVDLDLGEGRHIYIRRAGGANKRYGVRLSAEMKPVKFQIDQGTVSEDTSKRILYKVTAETIVVGWKGFKDDEGNDIEFTQEACVDLFYENSDIYSYVMQTANTAALYRKEEIKKDAEQVEK